MTILQQSPYLREQRGFPNDDLRSLANQVDHAYIDIAAKVNSRTIGVFALNFPLVTGEQWYLLGQPMKQQTLRQIYVFNAVGNIAHGINFVNVAAFTKCQGSFTDGVNYYGAIYASSVAIAGQVSFYITPTNIVVISGAGSPAIVSGVIVLEWLSKF
jgi:hypothetical protein